MNVPVFVVRKWGHFYVNVEYIKIIFIVSYQNLMKNVLT